MVVAGAARSNTKYWSSLGSGAAELEPLHGFRNPVDSLLSPMTTIGQQVLDRIAAIERADVERGIYIWKTEVERARHLNRHTKERTKTAEFSQSER